MKRISLFIILPMLISFGCNRGSVKETRQVTSKPAHKKVINLSIEGNNLEYVAGEQIEIQVEKPDTLTLDSVQVFFRGKYIGVFDGTETFIIDTKGNNPGKGGVRVKAFFQSRSESDSQQVEILSDIAPAEYKYRIVNSYPHDEGAYTQGLIYYDGWLYEGTGNYNQSSLRKVRLENGEVLQVRSNASDIFGEGITIFEGKIYQLTYKSQVCFVYDLNTFEEIQKHYFQNSEGWGLTNNDSELIMSDGTNVIYFMDPHMFTVKRQIEVYNDEGPVLDLNELEFINGKIYANRYYTDEIVIIDPETGKEEARVNLKGILPSRERKPSTNVLNGIAWDSENDRLFITGKYWPKLYEIKLTK